MGKVNKKVINNGMSGSAVNHKESCNLDDNKRMVKNINLDHLTEEVDAYLQFQYRKLINALKENSPKLYSKLLDFYVQSRR